MRKTQKKVIKKKTSLPLNDAFQNNDMNSTYNIWFRLGKFETKFETIEKILSSHFRRHMTDRILSAIYFLAVVIMFCYVKWGV